MAGRTSAVLKQLKYIELKSSGRNHDGPAWVALVKESKSGRTVYFDGRALKRGVRGAAGNYFDPATGENFWVSGVKRDGNDRHWAGSGKVTIEAAAVDEYLELMGLDQLDTTRFVVSAEIRPTEPSEFVERENESL